VPPRGYMTSVVWLSTKRSKGLSVGIRRPNGSRTTRNGLFLARFVDFPLPVGQDGGLGSVAKNFLCPLRMRTHELSKKSAAFRVCLSCIHSRTGGGCRAAGR